jgi:hypothetical protein
VKAGPKPTGRRSGRSMPLRPPQKARWCVNPAVGSLVTLAPNKLTTSPPTKPSKGLRPFQPNSMGKTPQMEMRSLDPDIAMITCIGRMGRLRDFLASLNVPDHERMRITADLTRCGHADVHLPDGTSVPVQVVPESARWRSPKTIQSWSKSRNRSGDRARFWLKILEHLGKSWGAVVRYGFRRNWPGFRPRNGMRNGPLFR